MVLLVQAVLRGQVQHLEVVEQVRHLVVQERVVVVEQVRHLAVLEQVVVAVQ